MNRFALAVGSIRAASGVSFLIAPQRAQLWWSDRPAEDPTTRILLRSMGYRDLLIGGGIIASAVRGTDTVPNWFLASAGADLADLVGGMAVKDELTQRDHLLGMGGAAVGISIGVAGAVTAWRSRSS